MNIRKQFTDTLEREFGNITTSTLDELIAINNAALAQAENKRGANAKALEIASRLPLQSENEVLEAAIKYKKFLLDIS